MATKIKTENARVARVTYSTYVEGQPVEKSIDIECNNEKELKTALNKKGVAIGMCKIEWGTVLYSCDRAKFLAICTKGEFKPLTQTETQTQE